MSERTYLGDSVYARFDGYQVWIYTDNGYGPNEVKEIALDVRTLDALNAYVARLRADHAPTKEEDGG